MPNVELTFERGTLLARGIAEGEFLRENAYLHSDARVGAIRCHAFHYRRLVRAIRMKGWELRDEASGYERLELKDGARFESLPHQREALAAWSVKKWGVVVMPTGSGKSFLACKMIEAVPKSTLVMVPTIDLLNQWQRVLEQNLGSVVGVLGGGGYDLRPITVSTYDSARIHGERIGNRFCLLVFDECHHLPGRGYAEMARCFIAPYRVGLTATPAEEEERVELTRELCGDVVFSKDIRDLEGDHLSPYEMKTLYVSLTESEREIYETHLEIYRSYRRKAWAILGGFPSWERFTLFAYRSAEGRRAMKSFMLQKKMAIAASEKIRLLGELLLAHRRNRILVFTHDNPTAFLISRTFLLPLVVHETKGAERREILARFRDGSWPFLVSSRVLNEGLDVPEADVAIVVSGAATVREHVQRLGRILRKKKGKKAVLYEMITENTNEVFTSQKRRDHRAYR